MTDEPADPMAVPRWILRIFGTIIICVLGYQFGLPFAFNALFVGQSARREVLLRDSEWSQPQVDPVDGTFSTVVLAGDYESSASELSPATSGSFEIVMRGGDLYFNRRWRRSLGGWRWQVETVVTNFYGNKSIKSRGYGSGGGGTEGEYGKDKFLAGRRLWEGNRFVGASRDRLVWTAPENSFDDGVKESFEKLERHGPFWIPREIVVFGRWRMQTRYKVRKVSFRNEPSSDWFMSQALKIFRVSVTNQIGMANAMTNAQDSTPTQPNQ